MQSHRISRPTPAFVVALVALVCALGGSAYAAAAISGKSIQKRSVPANRVMPNALTGNQIDEARLGVVPAADQAAKALEADKAKTADSATTAESATTANSATTATTATTASNALQLGGQPPSAFQKAGFEVRVTVAEDIPVNATVERAAACQAGEVAVGGGAGWYIVNTATSVATGTLSASAPAANGTAWQGEGRNTSAVARDFRAWAICAKA